MRRHFGDPDEIPVKPFERGLFLRLMGYVKPFRKSLFIAGVFMLVSSLTDLAGPLVLRYAIDSYIIPRNILGLWQIIFVYCLILVINWVSTYYNTYLATLTGQKAMFALRQKLFEHLQVLSFRFFDRRKAGKIMSRFTNDISALNQFLTSGILDVVSDLIVLCGTILLMLSMNWKLALVTFTTLPFVALTAAGMRSKVQAAYRDTRNTIADVNSSLQENISGVRVVQAFSREKVNMAGFEQINRRNFQANVKAATLLALFMPMVDILSVLGSILVIWYGARLVVAHQITVGILAAFLGYVTRFYSPVRDLSQVWGSLQAAMAASERVFEILDTPPEILESLDAVELTEVRGEVEFREVTFSYDGESPVLDRVSLHARPGEKIALVGPTGAGKTSIINLLARFYDADAGSITLDGTEISRLSFKSLRAAVGVVLQDTFIFAGTVRENIVFGCPAAGVEAVERVARLTGAHEFISRLPKGYETQVMERGVKLSAGQRQLLACARALLADPRILILDEATSSVDVSSEQAVQRALEVLMEGRTCFTVAHRLSTVRNADRILVIAEGKIVEEGPHRELMARKELYFRLYLNQLKELD